MLFSTTKIKAKGFMAYVWTLYTHEFQEGEFWNEITEKSKKVILFFINFNGKATLFDIFNDITLLWH